MQGTYSSLLGISSCTNCARGTFSTIPGAITDSVCQQCPHKKISVEGSNHVTNCTFIIGTTGPDGGPCVTCMPGIYKDTSGDIECVKCEYGKYSIIPGATNSDMCISCLNDSNSFEGINNIKDCVCIIGTTGPDGEPCINCLPAEYKYISGNMSCTKCVVGKYFDVHHTAPDNVCKQCPDNSNSLEGSSNKLQCM